MDLVLYDDIWYRSEIELTDTLLMANFNDIIRIVDDQYYHVGAYGGLQSTGSAAMLKMKLFTDGKTFDDFPMFYPMHTSKYWSTKLYIDEFGDLIEEAISHEN